MINEQKLSEMREKLRKHIVAIANDPNSYDMYNKGWYAGQMDLLNKILMTDCPRCGDPTDNMGLCRECE